jgi:hypothetical protein
VRRCGAPSAARAAGTAQLGCEAPAIHRDRAPAFTKRTARDQTAPRRGAPFRVAAGRARAARRVAPAHLCIQCAARGALPRSRARAALQVVARRDQADTLLATTSTRLYGVEPCIFSPPPRAHAARLSIFPRVHFSDCTTRRGTADNGAVHQGTGERTRRNFVWDQRRRLRVLCSAADAAVNIKCSSAHTRCSGGSAATVAPLVVVAHCGRRREYYGHAQLRLYTYGGARRARGGALGTVYMYSGGCSGGASTRSVTFSRRRSWTPPRACVCAPLAFSHGPASALPPACRSRLRRAAGAHAGEGLTRRLDVASGKRRRAAARASLPTAAPRTSTRRSPS